MNLLKRYITAIILLMIVVRPSSAEVYPKHLQYETPVTSVHSTSVNPSEVLTGQKKKVIAHTKSKPLNLKISAYSLSRAETDSTPNRTATMSKAIPGKTCAVSRDLKHLLGKQVHIDGIGTRVVNDLMGKHHRHEVDLCVTSRATAIKFGVVRKKVTIL